MTLCAPSRVSSNTTSVLTEDYIFLGFQVDSGCFISAAGVEQIAGRQLCVPPEAQFPRLERIHTSCKEARRSVKRRKSSVADVPKAEYDPDYVPKFGHRATASTKKRVKGVTDGFRKAAKKARKQSSTRAASIQGSGKLVNDAASSPFRLNAPAMLVSTGEHFENSNAVHRRK